MGGKSDVALAPDSSWVSSSAWLYGEGGGLAFQLFGIHPDGSGLHAIGSHTSGVLMHNALISAQDTTIFYGAENYGAKTYGYWLLSLASGKETNISRYVAPEADARFSPDGSQLAWCATYYSSNYNGFTATGSPHVKAPLADPRRVYVLNIARGSLEHFNLPVQTSQNAGSTESDYPVDMAWSNDGDLVLVGRPDAQNINHFWAINPRSGSVTSIGDKPGPGLAAQTDAPAGNLAVTYTDDGRPIGAAFHDATNVNQPASGRYTFANGATAYLDANSNLVVRLADGKVIDVEPAMVMYFPWTPPPAAGSGLACDCGTPNGVQISPDIQGIVDGNYLIYRLVEQTRIFGIRENRKSVLDLPFDAHLLF